MRLRLLCAGAAMLALAGCNDPAVENRMPPSPIVTPSTASVAIYGPYARTLLRQTMHALGGAPGALRASIRTRDAAEADAARARLIADGLDPAAITIVPEPDDVIVLTRWTVQQANCEQSLRPGWQGDVGNSIEALGKCVQADNLAAMLVDKGDMVAPTRLQPTNGATAAQAVLNWEAGKPGDQAPGASGGSGQNSGSQGSGGGSSDRGGDGGGQVQPPAASYSPSAAAVGGNPLLAPGLPGLAPAAPASSE